MKEATRILSALSSEPRLQVLEWLKNPTEYFPPQVAGDLVKDGVCGILIAEKLGISQPAASRHMRFLVEAGLVRPKRIQNWTFFKRDSGGIRKAKRLIGEFL